MTDVSAASGDVVEFLHHAGDRYKEHRELLRRRELEHERQQCPFRPTVTGLAERLHRDSTVRRSEAVEKRLHALHAKRLSAAAEKRAEKKAALEAQQSAELRPPRLTARARSLTPRDPCDVSRRWLEQRAANVSRLRDEALRRELQEVRDVPRISARAQELERSGSRGQRLEEHFALREAARRSRLFWLAEQSCGGSSAASIEYEDWEKWENREKREKREEKPFTPRITAHARRLRRGGDVALRLHNISLRSATDATNVTNVTNASEASDTFVPRVAPASAELSRLRYSSAGNDSHRSRSGGSGVYERLFRNERRRGEREEEQQMKDLKKQCVGVPRICETSRRIVERRRAAGDPPPHHRDTHRDIHTVTDRDTVPHTDRASRAHSADFMAECTFRPRVNAVSSRLWGKQLELLREDGAARSADEARALLWRRAQCRIDEAAQRRRALKAADLMAECTFRPRIGRGPQRRAGAELLSVAARGDVWRRRRDARLAAARAEAEAERRAQCPFRPGAAPQVFPLPAQEGGADIKGYEAHVARQCASRRRRAEAEEWWRPKLRTQQARTGQGRWGGGEEREEEREEEEEEEYGDDGASDMRFVVCQAPARGAAMTARTRAQPLPSGSVDRVAHNTEPSPVDFILSHHRAIVEASRRSGGYLEKS